MNYFIALVISHSKSGDAYSFNLQN